jgi:hypothetical protein
MFINLHKTWANVRLFCIKTYMCNGIEPKSKQLATSQNQEDKVYTRIIFGDNPLIGFQFPLGSAKKILRFMLICILKVSVSLAFLEVHPFLLLACWGFWSLGLTVVLAAKPLSLGHWAVDVPITRGFP